MICPGSSFVTTNCSRGRQLRIRCIPCKYHKNIIKIFNICMCLELELFWTKLTTSLISRNEASILIDKTNICFLDAETLRLVGGKKTSEGRIEVKHNGIWGSICTRNFSLSEAVVVCRSLGYNGRSVALTANWKWRRGESRRIINFDRQIFFLKHSVMVMLNFAKSWDGGLYPILPPPCSDSYAGTYVYPF